MKIGNRITVRCSNCGKNRIVVRRSVSKPYTKLCGSCATSKSHRDSPRVGRAESHYNWKGGINLNRQGYIIVYVKKTHQFFPMATNSHNAGGYILQHRLVMANYLGRCLKSYEIVHHRDGNRQNNKIENLRMTVRQKHGLAYSDAFQEGFKQGHKEARQKYDMSRQGYHDVDQFYKE